MTKRKPHTDRSQGGPGSSHQDENGPPQFKHVPHRSRISGGGGEMDSHHTHDPEMKGGKNS